MRYLFCVAALISTLVVVRAAAAQDAKPVPATPDNVASFLGEWTLAVSNSQYGNTTITLLVKSADGKVTGQVTDATGSRGVTLSKSGTSLVATYTFDNNGMQVDTVITLTPNDKEKRTDALVDFANGAAQFTGTATKK